MSCSIPLVIIMGQTGVGKSHFFNKAVGEDKAKSDEDLLSKMAEPQLTLCVRNTESVYLVDTPGFNDTKNEDDVILSKIVKWFKNPEILSYIANSTYCGILYLVEPRQRILPMLQDLEKANQRLLVVVTKGGEKRRDLDCQVFCDSQDSAWEAIRAVLDKKGKDIPVPLFVEKLGKLTNQLPKSNPLPKSKSSSGKFSWKKLWKSFFG